MSIILIQGLTVDLPDILYQTEESKGSEVALGHLRRLSAYNPSLVAACPQLRGPFRD
jgi:hypothetical protein